MDDVHRGRGGHGDDDRCADADDGESVLALVNLGNPRSHDTPSLFPVSSLIINKTNQLLFIWLKVSKSFHNLHNILARQYTSR